MLDMSSRDTSSASLGHQGSSPEVQDGEADSAGREGENKQVQEVS